MKKCPYCNEKLSDNAKFCHNCGEKYKEATNLTLSKSNAKASTSPSEDDLIDLRDIFEVTELDDGTYEISYGRGNLGSYTIPPYVSSIGEEAFSEIGDLTEINIGEHVKYIDINAFAENEYLSYDINVIFSQEAMESLEEQSCGGALSELFPYAEEMNIEISKTATYIPEGFFNESKLTEIVIPDSVEEIGEGAFSSCQLLENVTFGKSVKIIGDSAFEDCPVLCEVELPNSLEEIGQCAFVSCESLTEIVIPDKVATINDRAFEGCTSIVDVTIGEGVTTLGDYVFDLCDDITNVYLKRKSKVGKRDLIDQVPDGCNIERLPK